jgi:hypothetical protein
MKMITNPLVVAAMALAGMSCARAARSAEASKVYVLALANAIGDGKTLTIHLDCSETKVNAALATGYNAASHDVDAAGLKLAGPSLKGTLAVTLNPDPYVPPDGEPVACGFALDVKADGARAAGTYSGAFGAEKRVGEVQGTVADRPDYSRFCRFKLRFIGALHRLFIARGSNWKYALDMNMLFPMKDEKLATARFETIVPDYRRYSATLKENSLKFGDNALTGTISFLVDYGGQGASKEFNSPTELHTYTLRGVVVGEAVGGSYDVKIGELEGKDKRFAGRISFEEPPVPAKSLAFIRMHDAMKEGPVILNLSLADDGLLNGFAWASGYNHQPHSVDAAGLKLEGNKLTGTVQVGIGPDCYRPPERFTLTYQLDADIKDGEVTGTFTGKDRGADVKGILTGELRVKKVVEPPIAMENVRLCDLNLGYCLVSGPMPKSDWPKAAPNNAHIRFHCKDGKIESTEVVHPDSPAAYTAKVASSDLKIVGDRLTGTAAFDLESKAIQGGRYEFSFEGIVNGGELSGYWRGTHNGKDILTKSAKMYGVLTVLHP